MDRWRNYAGTDFYARALYHVGGATRFNTTTGAVAAADSAILEPHVSSALNLALEEIYTRLAVALGAAAGASKLVKAFDFTYASGIESYSIEPGAAGVGAVRVLALPAPYLVICEVRDRTDPPDLRPVIFAEYQLFNENAQLRWSLQHGAFFFSDRMAQVGPSRDYPLRLTYVPHPEMIDVDSEVPRVDIAGGHLVHEVICEAAALRLLADQRAEEGLAGLQAVFARDLDLALRSLRTVVHQPRTIRFTRKGSPPWP